MNVFQLFYWRFTGFIRFCLALVGLLWFGALALWAADRYVTTNGTDSGDFLTWATASSNIQWAVNVATNAGDTVWVSNGVYGLTNQIEITNNITVRGLNGYSNTLINGNWPTWTTRCFYIARTGMVDGFTVSNGHYWASNNYNGGGGAYLATGIIQNCYFVKNDCSNDAPNQGGGGVYIRGQATITNCTFFTNASFAFPDSDGGHGGAIRAYAAGGTNINISGCLIVSNRAYGRGGGIRFDAAGSPLLLSNCTVIYNYCPTYGVAILSSGSGAGMYFVDCVISNNNNAGGYGNAIETAASLRNCLIANNNGGRALLLSGGSATNCTIYGNRSTRRGAGAQLTAGAILDHCSISNNIFVGNGSYYTWELGGAGVAIVDNGFLRNCLICNNTNISPFTNTYGGGVLVTNAAFNRTNSGVINCTIVNNYSTNEGGGIATYGVSNYIVNCVIVSNSSFSNNYPNVYHRDSIDANKSNFYYSCVATTDANLLAAGQGNITNDPLFVGASAGNWRLANNSPCINRGTNISWMTNSYDLDGRSRLLYGTVDIGAYERIHEGTVYNFQ